MRVQIPLIGYGYLGRSSNFETSRLVNLYPEIAEDPNAKGPAALVGTPGTSLFTSIGDTPVRGMRTVSGVIYAVVGAHLYSVNSAGVVSAALGTLSTFSGRVSMADNGLVASGVGGNQLAIVDGSAGYIYNVVTGVFTTIVSAGFLANPTHIAYLDGYFIVVNGSMRFAVSNLYDGTTWNALAVASAAASADGIKAVYALHQQLWLIKETSAEVWFNAGVATSAGCPFQRIAGAVIDFGTAAEWSIAGGSNALFWLATQKTENGSTLLGVVKLQGYVPTPVAPPSIVYRISQLGTYSDGFAYCYSAEGHSFYVLTFPAGDTTLVYDDTTGFWHERSTYKSTPYAVGRHLGNCYVSLNNKHYLGDYRNGDIYQMNSSFYADGTDPLVAIRVCQHLADKSGLASAFIHKLQVDAETGVGSGAADPQAVLSWSDDGGHTWSNDYQASLGKVGTYRTRLIWRRLGYSNSRVFRLAISDPVKRMLVGAYVEASL